MSKELFIELLDVYWDDPVAFSEDMLDFYPDEWQRNVMMDLASNAKVSVRSGQGVGKTGLEAAVCLWFLTCRPNPKIVCTAPTMQQLYDVLWAEIAKWLNSSKIKNLLKWTKTKVYMRGSEDRWFATARTATKPENMQGFHEDYMLFIVDEASGVEDRIMEAILGTLSGQENKLLMCGNPTRNSGVFHDSHFADRSLYKTHKISSIDSPRTSKDNIAMLKRKYHEGSDVYRVRVLGEFPKAEPDAFIPLDIVEAAIMRDIEIDLDETTLHVGADISRYGDDETVIVARIGGKMISLDTYSKQSLVVTTGKILEVAKKGMEQYAKPIAIINVDDDGLGGGVTDLLRQIISEEDLDIVVNACHNGGVPNDKTYFANWATESWHTLRQGLMDQEIQLINDDDLVGQLSCRKYTVDQKGKTILESKKDMKKRLKQSPDRADAAVLAFANAGKEVNQDILSAVRRIKIG